MLFNLGVGSAARSLRIGAVTQDRAVWARRVTRIKSAVANGLSLTECQRQISSQADDVNCGTGFGTYFRRRPLKPVFEKIVRALAGASFCLA